MATITTESGTLERPRVEERAAVDQRGGRIIGRVLLYILMIFVALIFLMPILWMISTSLKPPSQLFANQIEWIPKTITFENYNRLFNNTQTPVARWFFNSLGIATLSTLLTLAVDALAAYAYARMDFPGRKFLFGLMILTLFVPGFMFLIP